MSRLHRPKAGFWLRLCLMLVYPIDPLLFRGRWRNPERIPPPGAGPVIIAINHLSAIDTFLMGRLVWQAGRLPRFLIKATVFRWPLVGYALRGARQIPVHRGTSDAAVALREAVAALDAGDAVVLYPEGTITRDPDNWPMVAKTGIARLVLLRPDVPVVPIGQWGAQHERGGRRWAWRRRRAEAVVGEPLDLSRFRGQPPSASVLREITDTVMAAIRELVAELRNEPAPGDFYPAVSEAIDRVA